MEKREKIIVVVSLIAAVYGALDFLVFSKKKSASTAAKLQNSSEIITAAKTKLSSQAVGGQVQNLIKQINTSWPSTIFYNQSDNNIRDEKDGSAEKQALLKQFSPSSFIYSGFLEMDGKKFAIINGTDYKLDDKIREFTLTDISPEKIQVTLEGEMFSVNIQPENDVGTVTTKDDNSPPKTNQDVHTTQNKKSTPQASVTLGK